MLLAITIASDVAGTFALQTIPTSVADAIYFARTTALVAILSIAWLGERLTVRRPRR